MTWTLLAHRALAVVLAVLVGVGLIAASDALIAALTTLPTLAALIAFVAATARHDHPSRRQTRRAMAVAVAAAAVTVIAVAALAGLVDLAGDATVPVLLLVGFTALGRSWPRLPQLLDLVPGLRPDRRAAPVEPNPAPGERPLVRVLDTLSTPALCREWRRSLRPLSEATDPATYADIVDLRRRYLDELDRRDPDALARWLALDPRPVSSDPRPHLSPLEIPPPEPRAADHGEENDP